MTEHKTHLKFVLRKKEPMSNWGFQRWGIKQRKHIAKSPVVWKPYASSRDLKGIDGIPVESLRTDAGIAEFFLDHFRLEPNTSYALQLFTHRKTKTHVGFTSTIAIIEIHDPEKRAYTVSRSGNLNRYWFRKTQR